MKDFARAQTIRMLAITAGIALNAFAVAAFCLPFNILVGGSTGVGRLIAYFSPLSVSTGVLIVNLLLLLAALIFMGRSYAVSIIYGSVMYPVLLGVFERIPVIDHMVEDPFVAAVCGGLLMGVGIGLVIRNGASLGGSDVIPQILHKRRRLPITPVMYGLDVIVLVCQGFLATPNEIILGILMTLTYSVVTDKVLLAGGGQVQFMIFSPKIGQIRDELIEMGFGVTLLHGKTGYYKEEVDVLITVLSVRFMNKVKDRILEIDDKAFMTIGSVREVDGRGFTISMDA
ncbi:MAG: YitT family protein [Eubacterium sp.]|nr:YitT family protein [Eubacterium sp.]